MIFSVSIFLNSVERKILRLQSLDKRVAIAAKIFLDDIVDSLVHKMIRNLKFLFVEGLDDQLAIDQILQRRLARFLNLFDQFFAVEIARAAFSRAAPTSPRTCE